MPIVVDAKFKDGDYIINRTAGDMAIVKGVTNKGYYTFREYYSKMFNELKDLAKYNFDLQVNYQKFYDFCTDEERKEMDDIIKEKRGT